MTLFGKIYKYTQGGCQSAPTFVFLSGAMLFIMRGQVMLSVIFKENKLFSTRKFKVY